MNNQANGKSVATPAASATGANPSILETSAGRQKLRAWAKKSGIKNISFWIPPDAHGDKEAVISKMADALNRYEEARAAGKIKYQEKIKFVRKA